MNDVRHLSVFFLSSCLALVAAGPAHAGDGTLRQGTDRIYVDITISFLYDEADVDSWKPMLDAASELLWNSTERQIQLGDVTLCNNSAHKSTADVWIELGTQGAKANPNGFGNTGRIWLSQTHKSHSGSDRGQFGFVHEMGHYLFGVYDEYKGVLRDGGPDGDLIYHEVDGTDTKWWTTARHFCVTNDSSIASIMDGGTKVTPNNQRTEYCTDPDEAYPSTTHRVGEFYPADDEYVETAQQHLNGESCWDTMVATMSSLTFPINAPTSEPQNSAASHEGVIYIGCEGRRFVTCIDRSGSMTGLPIDLARSAANTFVGLADDSDELGVSAFSSSAALIHEIVSLMDPEDRAAIQTAINSITTGGSTAMGDGLDLSLDMIVGQGDPAGTEAIVLLSDGEHNEGQAPEDVIPDLQARGVRVYAIGLGEGADAVQLGRIADQTSGKYYFAGTADDLPAIFTGLSAELHEQGILQRDVESIAQGEEVTRFVYVDGLAGTVTFTLTWGGSDLDLHLVTPGGTIVDPEVAELDPDIDFLVGATYESYRIRSPQLGEWQAVVMGIDVPDVEMFTLQVEGEDPEVLFQSWSTRDLYAYPEPVVIRAGVNAPDPITGAEVLATVTRPDNSQVVMSLYDDGDPDHADLFGGDGVYSNFFSILSGSGSYVFDLTAVNTTGMTILPFLPFVEAETSTPAPPFSRYAQTTIVIENVPADTEPPVVDCSVLAEMLWPPNHEFMDVGLSALVTDDTDPDPSVSVTVFSNEDDDEETGAGSHSPDAEDIGLGTLRLRSERKGNSDGRIYLIIVTATDALGHVGFDCCTVVVPHSNGKGARAVVEALAAQAEIICLATGQPPAGYVPVGEASALRR